MITAILARSPDFDLGKVVFVVIFLLVGFVQWLIKLWKQKREAMERFRQPPPSMEEIQARKEAWQQQSGQLSPSPEAPPPLVPRNPLEELLHQFREAVAEKVAPPQPVAVAPAPPPQPVKPPAQRLVVPAAEPVIATPVAFVKRKQQNHFAEKLAAIGGLRQAIVLREVLGPPKALQNEAPQII